VVRTVWFALFCLLGLGTVVAVRSTSQISAAVVSSVNVANAPRPTAKPDTQQDTLGKADRLPLFDVDAEVKVANAPSPTEAVSVAPAPAVPAATPKIVSRHWHDRNSIAPTDRTSAHRRAANKKDNKRNDAVAVDSGVDGSSCSKGSAFLRSLKLVPSCR
jgi:hypothetical protein